MKLLRVVVSGALLVGCASADKAGSGGATATREVAVGSARLRGGGVQMDVTIGRGALGRPVRAPGKALAPHAAVAP